MLELLQSFGTDAWEENLTAFQKEHDSLIELYASKRKLKKTPTRINGENFSFSPGKHNEQQKAVIEEFAPRFLDLTSGHNQQTPVYGNSLANGERISLLQ